MKIAGLPNLTRKRNPALCAVPDCNRSLMLTFSHDAKKHKPYPLCRVHWRQHCESEARSEATRLRSNREGAGVSPPRPGPLAASAGHEPPPSETEARPVLEDLPGTSASLFSLTQPRAAAHNSRGPATPAQNASFPSWPAQSRAMGGPLLFPELSQIGE